MACTVFEITQEWMNGFTDPRLESWISTSMNSRWKHVMMMMCICLEWDLFTISSHHGFHSPCFHPSDNHNSNCHHFFPSLPLYYSYFLFSSPCQVSFHSIFNLITCLQQNVIRRSRIRIGYVSVWPSWICDYWIHEREKYSLWRWFVDESGILYHIQLKELYIGVN